MHELAIYSHTTFKAHLLGLLGQHILQGGMRDESRKKSNPNGRRTQKSAHERAEREPKSEEKKKRRKHETTTSG